jgi:serine/threonine-protein kinase
VVDSGDPGTAGVREGDLLAGKYRIERVLGMGGMGVVVAAMHEQLEERVAIKLLHPAMAADAGATTRFLREARAAAKIKSPHVTRVFDVGTLPDGAPYMVMELLEGTDLAARLAQHGPLPVAEAVDFVLQTCVAAAEAHARGIVHRDLKPANLFCVREPDGRITIKVLDFGISKMADAGTPAGQSMTATSAVMGSPLYMSPEQMRSSKDVDARSDIWALGVILFQLLTARTPFEGETIPDLAIRIATEPPASLRALRPDVPPEIEAAVGRCLEKDRRARYPGVVDLARELVRFGSERASGWLQTIAGSQGRRASRRRPRSRWRRCSSPALRLRSTARWASRRDATRRRGRSSASPPPQPSWRAAGSGRAGRPRVPSIRRRVVPRRLNP